MAKPKLPYERVKEAAFSLHSRGEKLTQRAVRAISGGDPAAVGEHLKQLKVDHPELFSSTRAAAPELPAGFLRLLQDEIQRRISEASVALEGQLATALENIQDLARQVGELQEENSSLEGERDELAVENERLLGQVKQQATDLEQRQQLLAAERVASETARVDLAAACLRAKGHQELADSLQDERQNLRKTIDTERHGRLEAEKFLATANASGQQLQKQVDQLQKHLEQMTRYHDDLKTERDKLHNTLATERAALAGKLATAEAEAKAAITRADDLKRREADLQAQLREVRDELRHARTPPTETPTPLAPASAGKI